jgi:hypothetical protein
MNKQSTAAILESLPCCPIWAIEKHLREAGLVYHAMNGKDGNEIALVSPGVQTDGNHGLWRDHSVRGVATLDKDGAFVFELGDAAAQSRIYSAALRRIGWKGCEFARDVLGGAS